MAGLLDRMFATPSDQALFALGSGLLGVRRGNEGRAMMGALGAYNDAQQQERRNSLVDLQRQQVEAQMEQMRRKQRDDDTFRNLLVGAVKPPVPEIAGNEMDIGQPAQPASLDQQRLLQALLASGNPAMVQKAMELGPKPDEPYTLTPGAARFVGGREVARNPAGEKPSLTPFGQLLIEQSKYPVGSAPWKYYQSKIMKDSTHAPAPSATIVNKQESAEAAAVGRSFGDMYADIQRSGLASQSKVNRLDRFMQLLDGVETGKLTPAMTELAGYAKDFGLNIDSKLDVKQAARQLSNEMALQMRNPSGGAGMPGAMSDKDLAFLQNTVPGLANTPGGNRLMVETSKRLAKRDMQVAKMARDYRAKRGSLDEGFFDELQRFADENPLFDDLAAGAGPVQFYDKTGKRVR